MNGKFTQKMGNPASPMGQRIEAAKAREEADLTAKIERSRAADVDVRSFFTDEELAALLDDNESFNGTIADLSKMERYKRACAAAKWLEANSIEVIKVEADGVSRDRPNAIVSMDIHRLASLRDKELRVFTALTALADNLFISGIKDDHIRFTFGVRGIWRE